MRETDLFQPSMLYDYSDFAQVMPMMAMLATRMTMIIMMIMLSMLIMMTITMTITMKSWPPTRCCTPCPDSHRRRDPPPPARMDSHRVKLR